MSLSRVFVNFIRRTIAAATEDAFVVSRDLGDEEEIERLYQVSWNPTVKLQRLGKWRVHVGDFHVISRLHFLIL